MGIFWWSFSIKYFMPWCLWTLMMWNFKADITMDPKTGRGYGNYHVFWQIMGFVYPFIGLLCFFIPCCIVTTREPEFKDFNLDEEEDAEAREAQAERVRI